MPCDISESISSSDSLPRAPSSEPQSFQEDQNFTTPSNFKTRVVFYNESDPCADLEQHLAEFINSLFWILESKRLERSREKIEKVTLMLAPFEKKDIIGKIYLKKCLVFVVFFKFLNLNIRSGYGVP